MWWEMGKLLNKEIEIWGEDEGNQEEQGRTDRVLEISDVRQVGKDKGAQEADGERVLT